jgi:hypothetical protein
VFNAYYEHKGQDVFIDGEGFDVTGKFDGSKFFVEKINNKNKYQRF